MSVRDDQASARARQDALMKIKDTYRKDIAKGVDMREAKEKMHNLMKQLEIAGGGEHVRHMLGPKIPSIQKGK